MKAQYLLWTTLWLCIVYLARVIGSSTAAHNLPSGNGHRVFWLKLILSWFIIEINKHRHKHYLSRNLNRDLIFVNSLWTFSEYKLASFIHLVTIMPIVVDELLFSLHYEIIRDRKYLFNIFDYLMNSLELTNRFRD